MENKRLMELTIETGLLHIFWGDSIKLILKALSHKHQYNHESLRQKYVCHHPAQPSLSRLLY